jgi:hypothetical protein
MGFPYLDLDPTLRSAPTLDPDLLSDLFGQEVQLSEHVSSSAMPQALIKKRSSAIKDYFLFRM